MRKKRTSKLSKMAPIRLVGNEVVEIELQSFPLVRVQIRLKETKGRGKLIEVTGLDCGLQIQPWVTNVILIDSDKAWG